MSGGSADEARAEGRSSFRSDRAQRFYRDNAEVIFISHDASVTGAPILLLTLIEWWRRAGGPPFRIVLRAGGRLESRFRALGRVWNLDWPGRLMRPDPEDRARLLSFCGPTVRLIYANTGAVGDVLEALDPLGALVLAHVHELETMLAKNIGPERFAREKARARLFVVPSRAVAENLVLRHAVPRERITIVPEYLPDGYAEAVPPRGDATPLLVLGAGTTDWRKGPDLFVEMAAAVCRLMEVPVRFVWVGGATEPGQIEQLRRRATALGVAESVEFVGEQPDLRPHYRQAAVFVSSSREDPYPVVCLEAAAHGLPVVCFAGAGGIADFVGNDAGRTVPHLDGEAMAQAVAGLLADPSARHQAGECGRDRVRTQNVVAICGPRLRLVAETLMNGTEVSA